MQPDERRSAQHHKKLAIVTFAGLALALIVTMAGIALPPGETLWRLVAAPEEDGGWTFVTIDGADVREDGYSIGIRWSEITGFHNGCNSCGFTDDKPAGSADRPMTCTLVACPPRPHDPLFGRFAFGDPVMRFEGERLILSLPGHRAELVRAGQRAPADAPM